MAYKINLDTSKNCIMLSILVVSHNQKPLLERCLNSILKQEIPWPYEIIVSDDASTDGTWEMLQDYVHNYKEFVVVQVNSDDANPKSKSERSGYTRGKAYQLARGKYIVHIDGDDYLRGTNCYKNQCLLLEANPQCSMCMQNIWEYEDGQSIEEGYSWHTLHKFATGQIITAQSYFSDHLFQLNQSFMMRRNPEQNAAQIYGNYYVDSIITAHHLQFGPIVYLDQCDYVYVHYHNNISNSMTPTEQFVVWNLALTIFGAIQVPSFAGLYYVNNLSTIQDLARLAERGVELSDLQRKSLTHKKAFLYRAFGRVKIPVMWKLRLHLIRSFIGRIIKYDMKNSLSMFFLHLLVVGIYFPKTINFSLTHN